MPALLAALILGIVEGITEFLPVSSTGHLVVVEHLLDFKDVKDLFTVVIQVGAIAAVVWFYRVDLWHKIAGLLRWDAEAVHFWKLLIIATIPAGIAGLLLNSALDSLSKPSVIAATLIVGGIILWLVDRKPAPRRDEPVEFRQISVKRALLIGLGQCFAIVPGVSRSGATIVSGLLTGLNRPTATAFSFYLSIPVLVLASGLTLFKDHDKIGQLPGGAGALVIGLVASFITALIAVSWLLRYIAHHNFRPFAYYRIGAGVVILLLLAASVL